MCESDTVPSARVPFEQSEQRHEHLYKIWRNTILSLISRLIIEMSLIGQSRSPNLIPLNLYEVG